jgi:hypothetical protein
MIMFNKPKKARFVHYSDFDGLNGQFKCPVQLYCISLVEQDISGSLWVYPNRDEDCEWLPDCIYPSIRDAANNGNAEYKQLHAHYGLRHGELWGYLSQYEIKEEV